MTNPTAQGAPELPPLPEASTLYDWACDYDECNTYEDILGFARKVIAKRDEQWLAALTPEGR